MSDGKPTLVGVQSGAAVELEPGAAPAAAAASPPRERPGFRAGWALGALLAVAVLVLALQTGRVRALAREVAKMRTHLATANAELSAYRRHLGDVRERVADLQTQMSALDELVSRDPVTRAAEPPAAPAP